MSIHKALCHIVETSDFNRFKKASSYSSYIGVVSGEDSSSESIRRLGITKAAHAIGRTSRKKSKTLIQRQSLCSPEIINYCDKANERMQFITNHIRFCLIVLYLQSTNKDTENT